MVDGHYDPVPDLAAVLVILQAARYLRADQVVREGLEPFDRLCGQMGLRSHDAAPAEFEEGLRRLLAPPQPVPEPEPEHCPECSNPRDRQGRIAHKLSCPVLRRRP